MEDTKKVAKPDYEKYASVQIHVHEPPSWQQLLSKFRGCELAIVVIGAIVLYSLFKGEPLHLAPIGAILALGLVGGWVNWKTDAASRTNSSKGSAKPRNARGNEAAT